MDALELLHKRVSAPVLMEPGPNAEQLDSMLLAAQRAPDHGELKPWRFMLVEGEARHALGDLYVKAGKAANTMIDDEKVAKLQKMPLRAPAILVAIAVTQEHPKVPEVEQIITAGCAAQGVIQAAYAMGLGAMWRTGEMAFDPTVKAGLGLQSHEHIVGFIYLGTTKRFREADLSLDPEKLSVWGA
ncbi:nitroreductase family protein [Neptunomonas phycophila]|uniref:nitroreductase family protein n=1 Tax=Neptunomonas phycophila TaxID=1572645 RepID=UPI0015BFF206|nr:nitroreductase family protein [Neptunomonas phycophila]QLE97239.1 nitroreductase [Neptunomonas phycophila]